MNDFNRGIDYAFDYIEKHINGHIVNGKLEGVILREQLEELKNKIPKKCDFCINPCKTDWCCTKDKK